MSLTLCSFLCNFQTVDCYSLIVLLCLTRLGVPRPRIEPLKAIGTLQALPRPLFGLMLVLMGTWFPSFSVYTVSHGVIVLFSYKAYVLFLKLIKEKSMVDQSLHVKVRPNICLTYLSSISTTGWSTAGVADSKYIKVFIFYKCFHTNHQCGYS